MSFADLTAGVLSACRDAFGEAVTYTPQGESAESIRGIFNAKSTVINDGIPILTNDPSLGVKLSDFTSTNAPQDEDTVVVRGTTYKVAEVSRDGEGGAELRLRKA